MNKVKCWIVFLGRKNKDLRFVLERGRIYDTEIIDDTPGWQVTWVVSAGVKAVFRYSKSLEKWLKMPNFEGTDVEIIIAEDMYIKLLG